MTKALYTFLASCSLLFAWTLGASAGKTEVINAGINGNNSRQLLARLESAVIARQPELVVIGGGTNDAINSRNSVELNVYRTNIRTMVERCQTAGIDVVLLTAIPCVDSYVLQRHPASFFNGQTPSARVQEYVESLQKIGRELGVPVINLYQLYVEKGEIGERGSSWIQNEANSGTKDGVHPTAVGYGVIAEAVYQSLAKRQATPVRIICFGDSITFGAGAKTKNVDDSYPAQLNALFNAENPHVTKRVSGMTPISR